MPTILNNACINRVPKLKKVRFTSNDLSALKVNPYTLLSLKDGNISRIPIYILMFCDADADYTGSLVVESSGTDCHVDQTYKNGEGSFWLQVEGSTSSNVIRLYADESFNVGILRGPVELHIYYYEESVSVPFDFDYRN